MWDWDLLSNELTWSPTCKSVFGVPQSVAATYQTFLDCLHPDDREQVDASCLRSIDPALRAPFDTQYRVVWPDGSIHWILARGKVYFEGGRPIRFVGTAFDVSEQKEAEAHLRVVIDELSHRVKNTLAVIQSISEQTFKMGTDLGDVRQALAGRLRALAETHTLLTRAKWESVELTALVERSVGHLATSDSRFSVAGSPVRLTPKASLALGLVLNELATNAVKHGALATDNGTVAVAWRIIGAELVVKWTESGLAGLRAPIRSSFGSRLVAQAVEYDLDGELTRDFRPGGLHCVMTLPADRVLCSSVGFSN
jgi:PAS domain S-box-containing protein